MRTCILITATAFVTWIAFSIIQGVKTGTERLWLISAIKAPGRMALGEIQADMKSGHYELAKAKIEVFMGTWSRFDRGSDSFGGPGIGDIMASFSKIDTNHLAVKP